MCFSARRRRLASTYPGCCGTRNASAARCGRWRSGRMGARAVRHVTRVPSARNVSAFFAGGCSAPSWTASLARFLFSVLVDCAGRKRGALVGCGYHGRTFEARTAHGRGGCAVCTGGERSKLTCMMVLSCCCRCRAMPHARDKEAGARQTASREMPDAASGRSPATLARVVLARLLVGGT